MEMLVPKTTNKVFSCQKCEFEFCRICGREWSDEHFGIKCTELDKAESKEKKARRE
jgi:hypothetical protein